MYWITKTQKSFLLFFFLSAPSQVSEVIKERVQQHSVQLSWQEPEQPNGVITEYEIKYYEKVSPHHLLQSTSY